jgi:putative DNA primase/helicase
VALTGCSALGAISTVGAGIVDVRRESWIKGPTGLFILAVADSGERKSSVDDYFMLPIRNWESDQEREVAPRVAVSKAAHDAWKAEKKGILAEIQSAAKKGKSTEKQRDRLEDLAEREPEILSIPRLLFGDTTIEALTSALATEFPVGAVVLSEGGLFFGGYSMVSDSMKRTLSALNNLWDGKFPPTDRRTTDSYRQHEPRFTACIAIQAAMFRRFTEDTGGLPVVLGFYLGS